MPEEVKFNEEELKQVQNIQNSYVKIQNKFGQVKMAKLRLDKQEHDLAQQENDLEENLKSLQDEEKKFLDNITEKYGQGTLNPETGVFIPVKSSNKSE